MSRIRRELRQPLARWGFTTLALLALTTGQLYPALVAGTIAALAWKA